MNEILSQCYFFYAEEPAHFEAAKDLFKAYQQQLGEDLCFQSFDEELLHLKKMYGSPTGALLLVKHQQEYVGCVGLRSKGAGICEMKRLYVTGTFKGGGIGRQLATRIIDKAVTLGYRRMILDTLTRLAPALKLYQSLGFTETSAYYSNPLPGVVYMELKLA